MNKGKIYLLINREIHLPFKGSWSVEVYRQNISGKFSDYCEASKVVPKTYRVDAELYFEYDKDENVLGTPLWWWADGDYNQCRGDTLPVGVYKTETCHRVHLPIIKDREDCVESNVFKVEYTNLENDNLTRPR